MKKIWLLLLLLVLCLGMGLQASAASTLREPSIETEDSQRITLGDPVNLMLQYVPGDYTVEALETISLEGGMVLHSFSLQGERYAFTLYFLRTDYLFTEILTAEQTNQAVYQLVRHALDLEEEEEVSILLQSDDQRPGYRWVYPAQQDDRYSARKTDYGFFTLVQEDLEAGDAPYTREGSEYYNILESIRQYGNG